MNEFPLMNMKKCIFMGASKKSKPVFIGLSFFSFYILKILLSIYLNQFKKGW